MDYYPLQIINLGRNRTDSGYTEYLPAPALREYVLCYWFFRREGLVGDVLVNPDCCADIIFNLKPSSPDDFALITGTFGSGFHAPGTGICTCGIRLQPGMTYHLIREGVDSLSGGPVPAVSFRSLRIEHVAGRILGRTNREIADFFDSFLPSVFADIVIRESRFVYSRGIFNALVAGDPAALDVSEKTADRYFLKYFGLSRKKVSSILRFQKSIRHIAGGGLSVPEGYYDQSHFIKDFRKYSGLTPLEFARGVFPLE